MVRGAMDGGIFISYRREDAAGDAGRLADHLQRRFGRSRVFLDVDGIAPGTDFPQVLARCLQQTAVVLVVIGPRWASVRLDDGTRRLDSAGDFVRSEVEAALARGGVLVVPVLVQGAVMPRAEELPPSLASLLKLQAARIDHEEFHADAERLCDSLAAAISSAQPPSLWSRARRWWPAAALAAILAGGLALYVASSRTGHKQAAARAAAVETLVAEATTQRRRNQLVGALATLTRARELEPSSGKIRGMQEDIAMQWIREVRVEGDKPSFGDAIKPALAVIDAALASASGVRRADLLAHTGWATFLLWRDGAPGLNPTRDYQDALSIDPANPYANAMLAHWMLGQEGDLAGAVKLFDTAARSRRAIDDVRILQWAAYRNAGTEADAERVKLADAMRRGGDKLSPTQTQNLWSQYYFASLSGHDRDRQIMLTAVSPDDHISTLHWAFDEYAANDEHRRRTIRYYVAILEAAAGRVDRAAAELRALDQALKGSPGSLADAVRAALASLHYPI